LQAIDQFVKVLEGHHRDGSDMFLVKDLPSLGQVRMWNGQLVEDVELIPESLEIIRAMELRREIDQYLECWPKLLLLVRNSKKWGDAWESVERPMRRHAVRIACLKLVLITLSNWPRSSGN
jgi:hypothetical protein